MPRTKSRFIWVLFLVLIQLLISCGQRICPGSSTVTNGDVDKRTKQDTDKGKTIVLPDTAVNCYGVVTKFEFYCLSDGQVEFQMWRREGTGGDFLLIGGLTYTASGCPGAKVFDIPEYVYIPVRQNDVAGIYQKDGNGVIAMEMYSSGSTKGQEIWTSKKAGTPGQKQTFTGPTRRGVSVKIHALRGSRPEFDNVPSVIELAENTPIGTLVYTPRASDPNVRGTWGDILTINFTDPDFSLNNPFRMTDNGRIKTKGPFDYETQQQYIISLVVTDPVNRQVKELTVNIIDVNEPHNITNLPAEVTVDAQKTPAETTVFTVTSMDPEGTVTVLNHYLEYVEPSDGTWYIEKTTGKVKNKVDLNSISQTEYELSVLVGDTSNIAGPATLLIHISNLRRPPVIDNLPGLVRVEESVTTSASIFQIKATDPDGDTPLTYTLTTVKPLSGATKFKIDPNSGAVSFVDNPDFDWESIQRYILTFTVADSLHTSDPAELTVEIKNVNDAPKWSPDTYISIINEKMKVGTALPIKLNVTDPEGRSISFAIATAQGSDNFRVDPKGIYMAKFVDLKDQPDVTYTFDVIATDKGGASSQASVTVTIRNINDPHEISNLPNAITISADVYKIGAQVFEVQVSREPGDIIAFQGVSLVPNDGTFQINSTSGAVTVANDLSLGQVKYVMNVIATDPQISYTAGPAALTIHVEDINQAPTLLNLPATQNVDETETKARVVFSVKAQDPDADDTLTYSLVSVKPSSGSIKFQFSETTGEVSLYDNPFLDATKESSYELTITVRDQYNQVSKPETLTITINDVNQPPILSPKVYSAKIEEKLKVDSDIGVTFEATDPDPGDVLTFTLGDSPGSKNFKIVGKAVRIAQVIDVGQVITEKFTMSVTVTDKQGLSDIGSLEVTVNNVNDPHTMPDLPAVKDIDSKTTKKDQVVYTVQVEKEDMDTITYKMSSKPDDGLYTMDLITGQISVTKDLSTWKGATEHTLSIITSDGTFNDGPKTLQLNLKNFNAAPVIQNLPQVVEVRENTAGDVWIFKILSEDPDKDPVTYKLISMVPSTNEIQFDAKDGITKVVKNPKLDYETASEYVLTVTASDGLWTTDPVDLTVKILDVNEKPVFDPTTYTATIPEEQEIGTVVPVGLNYADPDKNDTVQLSITDGADSSLFSVKGGKIVVAKRIDLDAGQADKVTLQVVAKDEAGLSAAATVTINIENVNEQHVITNLPADVSISAQKVKAGDEVYSLNVEIKEPTDHFTYSLTSDPDDKVFTISNTGEITCTKSLQDSTVAEYRLAITVMDRSSVFDAGPAELRVAVTDLKRPPVWENLPSTVTLQENTVKKTNIFTVRATDPDGDEVTFRLVDVSPVSGETMFAINKTTGKINTIPGANYDFEGPNKVYTLTIEAADYLFSANASTLTVELLDVNEPPQFNPRNYTVTIPEEEPAGYIVLEVAASDLDKGDKLDYSVLDGAASNLFQMDDNKLKIRSKIDYESGINPNIHLGVIVADAAGLTNRADVYITLTDVNDNTPVFTQTTYHGNVTENTFGGLFVLTVTATDKDSEENGRVTYSIKEGGDGALYFQVDPDSGVVRVKQQIDYEDYEFLTFQVLATDNGTPRPRSASANVVITIRDINDNRPTFLQEFYNVEVPSDRAVGSKLATLQAVDQDSEITARVHYHLLINSDYFNLGERSGEVSISHTLQTDVKYLLYSYAKDDGHPAQTSNIAFVRIDSFDEWRYLVDMELNIDIADFTKIVQRQFLKALNDVLSPWIIKIDKFVAQTDDGRGFTYRRRLLATGTKTLVTIYGLKDNLTDSVTNVDKPKNLVDRNELLAKTRKDLAGNPQDVMTTNAFADFLVTRVSPTKQRWFVDTVEGVVLLCFLVLLALLLAALLIGLCCCWRKELYCFGRKKKDYKTRPATPETSTNQITPVEQPDKPESGDFFRLRYWKFDHDTRFDEKNELKNSNTNISNNNQMVKGGRPPVIVPATTPRKNDLSEKINNTEAKQALPRPTTTESIHSNVYATRRPPAAKPARRPTP